MRISDWSSDVCSSDLSSHGRKCSDEGVGAHLVARRVAQICGIGVRQMATRPGRPLIDAARGKTGLMERVDIGLARCRETAGDAVRSEERREGKECGSTCSSGWVPYH